MQAYKHWLISVVEFLEVLFLRFTLFLQILKNKYYFDIRQTIIIDICIYVYRKCEERYTLHEKNACLGKGTMGTFQFIPF